MTRILGIDPGLSGAIAILHGDGHLEVFDIPTFETDRGGKSKRQVDVAQLASLMAGTWATSAILERVGAMPGQGVSSMFSFGRTVGQIEGILGALRIPVTLVAPAKWKRDMAVTAGKDGSRLRASELMPAYAEQWRRKKDDGRAEAALLALWGVTHMVGRS